jgi:hypothetical protein
MIVKPSAAPEHMLWASPADAAAVALTTGWWVFPCRWDKEPACHWPSWATCDTTWIEEMWPREGAAVGIACKPSGLVVIDWDRSPGPVWPRPVTLERLSCGRHLPHQIFEQRSDREWIGNPVLDFGEVKGAGGTDGGYVVLSDLPDNGQAAVPCPDEIYDAIEMRLKSGVIGAGVSTPRAAVHGPLRELLSDANVFTGSTSTTFVTQHVKRWREREGPGDRHVQMLRIVESAFIEGMAGDLDLTEAYDALYDEWSALKPGEDGEYERLWRGELERYEGGNAELLEKIEERKTGGPGVVVLTAAAEAATLERITAPSREAEERRERAASKGDEGGAEPPPSVTAVDSGGTGPRPDACPVLPREFWDKRPVLGKIRDAALNRLVSPDVLLGACATRTVAMADERLLLDPSVSNIGNKGIYVAAVGRSGSGKSVVGIARELLPDDARMRPSKLGFQQLNVGSSAGILKRFFGMIPDPDWEEPEEPELTPTGKPSKRAVKPPTVLGRVNSGLLLVADEMRMLADIGGKGGMMTFELFDSAYTNAELGFTWASEPSSLPPVEPCTYTISAFAGLQPELAAIFVNPERTAGGTVQRWTFLSASHPDKAERLRVKQKPLEPLGVKLPTLEDLAAARGTLPYRIPLALMTGELCVEIPPDVWLLIREMNILYGEGFGERLDGHLYLMQKKWAACLMMWDGRISLSQEDWDLAGEVVGVHREVRAWTLREGLEEEHAVGVARVAMSVAVGSEGVETAEERSNTKGAWNIATWLWDAKGAGEGTGTDAFKHCSSRIRGDENRKDHVRRVIIETGWGKQEIRGDAEWFVRGDVRPPKRCP